MADDISFSAELDTGNFDAGMMVITGALLEVGSIAVDALFAAGAAVADFVGDSFAGAIEAEQGFARLTAQIEAQGDSAAVTAGQAAILADEYKHLAGGSDDAVIAAEAVLLKFNAIGSDIFPTAIEQSANLAALMGTDLASASQLLGLALDDPTASLTRLDKATGAFTEAEQLQIKAMAEAGDVAGAQALILANLEEAIGGTAETLALTTAGQWAIFQESIADAGESIAAALLPALSGLLAMLMPLIPVMEEVATAFGLFFEILMSGDVGGAFDVLGEFDSVRAVFQGLGIDVYALGTTFQGIYDWVIANIPLVQATFTTVFTAIQGVFAVLSDFVTVTLMPAIASIWEQSGVQLPTAQATFEAVMNGIVVATQLVSDFITNILVPVLTSAVDWVVANWPAIQAKIEEVWAVVQPILQATADFIIGTVIPTFAQAVDWVVANWPTIQANIEAVMAAVQTVINTVMNEVVPFVLEMFGQIKSWVDTNWPLIQATIETIINNISTSIHSVIDPLVAFWIANHETIQAVATAIWENMKLSISTAITAIGGIITVTMQLITGDWTGAWTTIQTTLTTIWANMQEMASNSMTAISAVVTDLLAALKVWWDAKWIEIQNSVTTILASILTTISTTVANMVTAFTSIDWLGIGAGIITSIQTGITNLAGSLAQSAADAAYAAYQAMLSALGMGSPSTLFVEAGENTMDSMGAGMTDATGGAMVAANDAAMSISDAFIDPFTLAMMMAAEMQQDVFQTMGVAQETFVTTSYDMGLAAGQAYVDPFTMAMMMAVDMQASAISDMTDMQYDFVQTSSDLGAAAGQAYIDPFTQAMMMAAEMQSAAMAPVAGPTNDLIAPVTTTRPPVGGTSTISTTDARTYNLNASTSHSMQTVSSEFSTMQTLAGL